MLVLFVQYVALTLIYGQYPLVYDADRGSLFR